MTKKRVRRTKEQIQADNEKKQSKGLGDDVEKVLKATGIAKVAKFLMGEDCGCDERKEKLNNLFPRQRYKKALCLEEDEYQWLTTFTKLKSESTISESIRMQKVHHRVFQSNRPFELTSCKSCLREMFNDLKKVYENY